MALATLSVDLVAKLAKFEDDMGKAARASEKASQRITQSLTAVGTGIASLAAGLGVAGLVGFTKQIVDGIDALNDLKDATGASIENISALEDIAARTGTSFDTVGTSLIKFNAALKDAKPSSDTANALKAIGLSADELKKIDPAEALRLTAVALAGFADDGNKARLTQELFGKSLKEVAPLLKDLAEQGSLNATVTTAQAQAAEDFNKQLSAIQKNADDASRGLALSLLPSLIEFSDELVVGAKNAGGFLAAIGLIGSTNPFKTLSENVATYREDIAGLEQDKKRYQNAGSDTRAIDEALETARKRLAYFEELRALQNSRLPSASDQSAAETKRLGLGGKLPSVVAPEVKPKGPKGADPDADFKRYIDNLQKQIDKTKELTLVQQLGADVAAGRVTLTPDQITEAAIRAETADALIAQAKATEILKKASEEATKQTAAYFDGLIKSEEELRKQNQTLADQVAEIGLSKDALNALTLARIDSTIAQQAETVELLRGNEGTEAEIKLAERALELLKERRALTATGQIAAAAAASKDDAARASADYAKTLEGDLKGAFSAAFRDSKDPIGAFGDALANVIYTRASSALADALIQSAFNSTAGSAIASFFGFPTFDGGGFTGAGSRSGGVDGKGGFMALLHPNETVIDHTKGQSSGGSVTVNQYFTVGDVPTVSMVKRAVADSERRIAGALGRSKQYGGALA